MTNKHANPETMIDIDWTQLINMLGGPSAVTAALPYPELKRKNVYQWWLRGSVPGRYVLPLVNLALAKKIIANTDELPKLDPFAQVRA